MKLNNIFKNKDILKFLKFGLSSGTSFALDLLLFQIVLLGITYIFPDIDETLKIWFSTIAARVCSSLYNYLINKILVFKNKNKASKTIWKYYILCILQMCCSAILVALFKSFININETIIKFFVDIILFLISYWIQNKVIFNDIENK